MRPAEVLRCIEKERKIGRTSGEACSYSFPGRHNERLSRPDPRCKERKWSTILAAQILAAQM